MAELLHDIISNPLASGMVVFNLILIESLLSVDNAAVLATMVLDLPEHQRGKALRYGILGAYLFRGLCLLFASFLIQIWWLKPLGGVYLLFLTISYIRGKYTPEKDDDILEKEAHWFYRATKGSIGVFWSTVALIEVMDLAFSIDNVFAAVALTDNIILVWLGVFIGILAMRFVAQAFVSLMEKYPFLEGVAFAVIGVLGCKLGLGVFEHLYPESRFAQFLGSHLADAITSGLTVAMFAVPVLTSALFGWPGARK